MKDERLPPQDLVAERAVLGCQILDGSAVESVSDIISVKEFYSEVHGIIQKAILEVCKNSNGTVDALLVADQLARDGTLDEIGGPPYLLECLESVPHSAHATYYAKIVSYHFRRREGIRIGQDLVNKLYDPSKDAKDVVEAAHDAAMKMAESLQVTNSRPRLLSEHVTDVLETYRKGQSPTVWWGVNEIDNMLGGVAPGELVIIAAGTSQGKTLNAMQWIEEASRKGIPGIVISEEMSAAMLATRTLNYITVLPSDQWRDEADAVEQKAKEHFADRAPVLIAEKCHTIGAAERAIARAVQSHGVRIVAVDYAQILEGEGDTIEQKIGDVSTRMKAIAMKHDMVVLLLAQLNRGIDARQDPTPQLKDLRGSGRLEQDADIVMFPFWPWKIDDTYKPEDEYRFYVRKNRSRGIRDSVIKMRINAARQRIEPWEDTTPDIEWPNG